MLCRRAGKWLFLLISSVSSSPLAWAQCSIEADIADAFGKLQSASQTHTISGTFLRESAGSRDFIALDQGAEDGSRTGRYINSDATNAEQTLSSPIGGALDICDIARFYSFAITGGPKVAGKATRLLRVRPKDALRLGYSLAIDSESGVILRSDAISETGELLERQEFATVNITPRVTKSEEGRSDPAKRYLNIPGLPTGYRANLARGFEERALFVSDGIAAATVTFEPLPPNVKQGEGAVRRGATLTYTRGSAVGGNKVLVTVTGEVPLAAARVIADSVKLTASKQ